MLTGVTLTEHLGEIKGSLDGLLPKLGFECKLRSCRAFADRRQLEKVSSDNDLGASLIYAQKLNKGSKQTCIPPNGRTSFRSMLPTLASLSKRSPSTMDTAKCSVVEWSSKRIHTFINDEHLGAHPSAHCLLIFPDTCSKLLCWVHTNTYAGKRMDGNTANVACCNPSRRGDRNCIRRFRVFLPQDLDDLTEQHRLSGACGTRARVRW